jgi:hypothetical protein
MTDLGLIVYDEQGFFSRVISAGTEQGLFTRDRADEIIRIAVAMANKYVVEKEVDFRSEAELAKVQETIIKLIGVGLEIKSRGDVDQGVMILQESSPVDLFRLAYTRVEKLRSRWRKLLKDHGISILVTKDEFECLSDISCRRLAEMSIFTDSELHTIRSLTLPDELFTSLGLVEYYEEEAEKYEFILKLKRVLPFDLLNKSPNVMAESLSEVDSIREALTATLIISDYLHTADPVAVSMPDVRNFLESFSLDEDPFTPEVENAVLDVIHELGEDLGEDDGALLTREVIRIAEKTLDTIISEWDLVNASSENVFYKRWSRMVILSDAPEPMERILTSGQMVDEFDFELVISQLATKPAEEAQGLIKRLPWKNFLPEQTIRLFHQLEQYQENLAGSVTLSDFNPGQLIDLVEELNPKALKTIEPALRKALDAAQFTMEDLELLAGLPSSNVWFLAQMAGPPVDYDMGQMLTEFKTSPERIRQVVFHAAVRGAYFPELFQEAWLSDPAFVKKQVKFVPVTEIGHFIERLLPGNEEPVLREGEAGAELQFRTKEINAFFKSLPAGKKKAAVKYFQKKEG